MKNCFDIKLSHFSDRYSHVWACVLFCVLFLLFLPNITWAQEGYNVHDGYACPGMNILKERYQGDCFPCEIVNVLLSSFMRAASKVYDVSKEAGNKLLLLGSAIWLAFWALRKLSSLANVEPSSMTNELIVFFGKVLVAYCFINAGIGTLINYAVNPIMGAGAEFGNALLLETENIDTTSDPKAENQYQGPTDIISQSVMNKILKLSEAVSNEVATNFVIGSGLTCFSIQHGFHIKIINVPDIWLWLCGAAIWCVGFMLVLAVCYYLIDIPFKIGFAIMALPIVIGLWPFKITAGKLKSIIGIALNAAFTFVFLALSSSYAIRLISQAFSAEGDLEDNGQVYSGKEALFKAFEIDNVEYVKSMFDFSGPGFLIILFCYIYGFKMISSITNDYPNKFDTGMTSAAGSPIHHMATAATMWTANKVAAPFKTGLDIVAHQAGKAATTVTKAAANVGIGAAGAAVGSGSRFIGKSINNATSGWVERQKNLKAAADSLDKQNSLQQAGMGARMQSKVGQASAAIGLGLANTVNRLGKSLEKGGDSMMNPGRDTFNRVASATKAGWSEMKDAGKELGGALKETAAAVTPNKIAQNIGLGQIKQDVNTQARQDFRESVEGFNKAVQTVGNSMNNTGQKLSSAFSAIRHGAASVYSGEASAKLADMTKAKIKYVSSGKFLKPLKDSFAQSAEKTRQDILKSKDKEIVWDDVKANVKNNFGMVQADAQESLHSLLHGNMKANWNDLKDTVSNLKQNISDDTGIKNNIGITAATATGIGLGIAAARHLGQNVKDGAQYVGEGKEITGLMSGIGTGVIRPSIALGMTIGKTASDTFDSAYKLTEGTVLTGIGIAQTILSPVGNLSRSATHAAFAIGDTGASVVSAAGGALGMVTTKMNVWYQYTKYATRPAATVIGLPFRGIGNTLGFAAKTVDNTLYGGYRAVASVAKGTVQVGNVLGQGANVLYHGVKDHTMVGQTLSKTFKSGSKTLNLATKSLKLGRNVILAAAGENVPSATKESRAERDEKNRLYREKQKEKKKLEEQKRRKEEKRKEEKERLREQEEFWKQQEDEARRAREEEAQQINKKNRDNLGQTPFPNEANEKMDTRAPQPRTQTTKKDDARKNNRPVSDDKKS